MNIHILQHVAFEGPGYIATWAEKKGYKLSYVKLYEAGTILPQATDVERLIIMGGPMSVYDGGSYPWMNAEKALINECLEEGKRMLGICLGAQLIASCLDATVLPAANKEIGWHKVSPTGNSDLFNDVFKDKPVMFHWHGESFNIPDGTIELLSSPANRNQAFLFNDHAMALQFHPEATRESIQQMLQHCAGDMHGSSFVQTTDEIMTNIAHCDAGNAILEKLLNNFYF